MPPATIVCPADAPDACHLVPDRRRWSSVPILGDPATRPGIAGTAYDTAWLASVPAERRDQGPRFPSALQWLVEHQLPDGSWGGSLRYEHDRILSTLAALAPLATFGRRAADRQSVQAGIRYLWQHGHLLPTEPMELVGLELLLPSLVERARRAGVAVPPHLDVYGNQRREKLRLLPSAAIYSPNATVAHSLEFLGEQVDPDRLRAVQGANGAIGNSPAATAFYVNHTADPRALAYLESCLTSTGGAMAPVLHPCETFELLWAAYHLFLAGVPAAMLLTPTEQHDLRAATAAGGVSLSPSFPIADADDTAVALILLDALGAPTDVGILQGFATTGGHFATFPFERHTSVGVNVHVLHALARLPGYPNAERVIGDLLDYLAAEQRGGLYWLDKWHISPYYATAHVLCVLAELPERWAPRVAPLVGTAREWLRQTQYADGSWGFYGQPTAEETAYAVLALATTGAAEPLGADRQRCVAGMHAIDALLATGPQYDQAMPPLWIDKCLYRPTLVVRAAITAACVAARRLGVARRPGAAPVRCAPIRRPTAGAWRSAPETSAI